MPEEKPKEVPIYVDRIEVPAPRKGLRSDSVHLLGDVPDRELLYSDITRRISTELRPYVCIGRGQQIRNPRTFLTKPPGTTTTTTTTTDRSLESSYRSSPFFIYPDTSISRNPFRSSQYTTTLETSTSDNLASALKSHSEKLAASKQQVKSSLTGKTLKDFFTNLPNSSGKPVDPVVSGSIVPPQIKRSRQFSDLEELSNTGKKRCLEETELFSSRFGKCFHDDPLDDLDDFDDEIDDEDEDEDDDEDEFVVDDGFKRIPRLVGRPAQTILVEEEGDIDTTDAGPIVSDGALSPREYHSKPTRSSSPPPASTPLSIMRCNETRNSSSRTASSSLPSSLNKYVPLNHRYFSSGLATSNSDKNTGAPAKTTSGAMGEESSTSRDYVLSYSGRDDRKEPSLFRGVSTPPHSTSSLSLTQIPSFSQQPESPTGSGSDGFGFFDDPDEEDEEEDDIDDQSDQEFDEDEFRFHHGMAQHSQSDSYFDDLSE